MRLWLVLGFMLYGISLAGQDIPYVIADHFEFKLDYTFKVKPPPERYKVSLEEEINYSADLLPFVKVSFTFLEMPEDAFRVRVFDGKGSAMTSKKVKNLDKLAFDLGFSDDIKDRVQPHSYFIYLESKDKVRIARIKIFVEENGDFYLNDKLYGRI